MEGQPLIRLKNIFCNLIGQSMIHVWSSYSVRIKVVLYSIKVVITSVHLSYSNGNISYSLNKLHLIQWDLPLSP